MTCTSERGKPVLLLIPGLGTTARYFDCILNNLQVDHRVLTIDLPGHGDSRSSAATLHEFAAEIAALLAENCIECVSLVGWSLGATAAYTYLERYGSRRVGALVSVEQTPYLLLDGEWSHAAFGTLDRAGADGVAASLRSSPLPVMEGLVKSFFAADQEPDPQLLDVLLAETRRCRPEAVCALFEDAVRQDWRARIRRLAVPKLFVHGMRSQIYPSKVGQWLGRNVPGARLAVLERSGHVPFIEEPESFCQAVRSFVAGVQLDEQPSVVREAR